MRCTKSWRNAPNAGRWRACQQSISRNSYENQEPQLEDKNKTTNFGNDFKTSMPAYLKVLNPFLADQHNIVITIIAYNVEWKTGRTTV
jgi:hypothetical protein